MLLRGRELSAGVTDASRHKKELADKDRLIECTRRCFAQKCESSLANYIPALEVKHENAEQPLLIFSKLFEIGLQSLRGFLVAKDGAVGKLYSNFH